MDDTTSATFEILDPAALAASQPFVGRWNTLVSTTNWEKGRIISQWREELASQQASIMEYSDEAWARLVGGVTGQHTGRLRRVYQRFGQSYEQFAGLYWSHFQSAVEWEDAEMWLEGAVQNKWSVNSMRRTRWETLGSLPEESPRAEDVIANETDEDFEPARKQAPENGSSDFDSVQGPDFSEGPDFGDGDDNDSGAVAEMRMPSDYAASESQPAAVRPFENLPPLPDDVAEAFEQFKLVILRHKAQGWSEITCDDLAASLESLKQLALAPSLESAN